MTLCLNVHTGWECNSRTIYICGFQEPTPTFTTLLDAEMEGVTVPMTNILDRYVKNERAFLYGLIYLEPQNLISIPLLPG